LKPERGQLLADLPDQHVPVCDQQAMRRPLRQSGLNWRLASAGVELHDIVCRARRELVEDRALIVTQLHVSVLRRRQRTGLFRVDDKRSVCSPARGHGIELRSSKHSLERVKRMRAPLPPWSAITNEILCFTP